MLLLCLEHSFSFHFCKTPLSSQININSSENSMTGDNLPLLLSRFSRVRLFATPWTAAYEAPLSTGFSRQEDWSGVPLPSPNLALVVHIGDVTISHVTNFFHQCPY